MIGIGPKPQNTSIEGFRGFFRPSRHTPIGRFFCTHRFDHCGLLRRSFHASASISTVSFWQLCRLPESFRVRRKEPKGCYWHPKTVIWGGFRKSLKTTWTMHQKSIQGLLSRFQWSPTGPIILRKSDHFDHVSLRTFFSKSQMGDLAEGAQRMLLASVPRQIFWGENSKKPRSSLNNASKSYLGPPEPILMVSDIYVSDGFFAVLNRAPHGIFFLTSPSSGGRRISS